MSPGAKVLFQSASTPLSRVVPLNPTDIVGNYASWVADNITGTNAGGLVTNWANVGPSGIAMTNWAAGKFPAISNNYVYGHALVHFVRATPQYMLASLYTSSVPHEVVMVIRFYEGYNSSTEYYFDSANSSYRNYARSGTGNTIQSYSGNIVGSSSTITNKFYILDCVFNGASGAIYTNNVSSGVLNTGSQTMSGFVLATAYTLNNAGSSPIDVAEIDTFTNASLLGGIDSAGVFASSPTRTGLFIGLTNKYNVIP